jgi:hypothetical protein
MSINARLLDFIIIIIISLYPHTLVCKTGRTLKTKLSAVFFGVLEPFCVVGFADAFLRRIGFWLIHAWRFWLCWLSEGEQWRHSRSRQNFAVRACAMDGNCFLAFCFCLSHSARLIRSRAKGLVAHRMTKCIGRSDHSLTSV